MDSLYEEKEVLEERFQLAIDRIKEILEESYEKKEFEDYFHKVAGFLVKMKGLWIKAENKTLSQGSLEELRAQNQKIYEDLLPENYKNSYLNPAYATVRLGEDLGPLLSFLYAEMRGIIAYIYDGLLQDFVIRMEVFLEVYHAFEYALKEKSDLPSMEEIRTILYWFISDYQEQGTEQKVTYLLGAKEGIARSIVMESDLTDLRYLYSYGEYITENEEKLAAHMNKLSEETIKIMADTYTEGYRMGFINGNKDITIKKTVAIYYSLGFERMVRQAVYNFEKMGLRSILYRAPVSEITGRSLNKPGFYGAYANKQFEYDHEEDSAFYFDKAYVKRKLEVLKTTYEKYKEDAAVYGGPAVIEVFGEIPFAPQIKKEAFHLTQKQQKLNAEFSVSAGDIVNQYIKGEERSFTIIAFPTPAIGTNFSEIFDEVIRINTLDYKLYQGIQQTLIDTLDQAEYVTIKGMNGNRTDLRVAMHRLVNPEKETNFENCVADVNIPVGEVFTSPRLAGTNGILHVTKVFLHELEYKDLEIEFKDGMTAGYGCANFEDKEAGKKYIKDNVLNHHESLPMGEFAIGTNTTAYIVAKKYSIEDKLPILITEKMGPHFALGDTCYSHGEDVCVYNPDGKEIVAKDNEVSILRKTDRSKAYFIAHTDITIPYEELGELMVVKQDGSQIEILKNGQFVLKGLEELNRPLLENI